MSNINFQNYLSKRLVLVTLTQLFSMLNAASIPITTSTSAKNACITLNKNERFDIECASLRNEFELNEIFPQLNVSSSNPDLNATFNRLAVMNSTLNSSQTLFDHPLFQSLLEVSLENVTFYHRLSWADFDQLPNLQVISIYNTTLPTSINTGFGKNFNSALQSLTITNSNITDIKADSFKENKNLRYLRISHNKLKSFPKLISVEELEEIRLDWNCIHSLEAGVFNDFPKLKVLSLSSNSISTIPENVFSAIWNSTVHIELRDNPIKCDCRLLWTINFPSKPGNIIGQCASPKRLFGKNLKDLTVEDLAC